MIDYFSSNEKFGKNDFVMVEAEYGDAAGKIVAGPLVPLPSAAIQEMPKISRAATQDEIEIYRQNMQLAAEAREFCKKHIALRNLEMKLVDVEVFYDRSKFIFYFTAPTRIDFRDLVKDLVKEYRARIELRQIGARHETQMIGAIGNCGRVCCCHRHLRKFAPVTIKMAKEQRLFLNPAKISGICGRLLCCLSYEQENYEDFHNKSPRPGKRYQTAKGVLKVLRVNMFKDNIIAVDEENQELTFSRESWEALKPWRPNTDSADTDTYERDMNYDYDDRNYYPPD